MQQSSKMTPDAMPMPTYSAVVRLTGQGRERGVEGGGGVVGEVKVSVGVEL